MRGIIHLIGTYRGVIIFLGILSLLFVFLENGYYTKMTSSKSISFAQEPTWLSPSYLTSCPSHHKPARGFTISIEEMVHDETVNPSTVKIERSEYEIPQQNSLVPRKITGNKFIVKGENFVNPKVKNSGNYLKSLGFDPEKQSLIIGGPGHTQIGYIISYESLRRMIIYESSPFQLTIFLSDSFTLEE